MIFGAKEEMIPKYYDDDKPKSVQKTAFGLAQIILLWLGEKNRPRKRTAETQPLYIRLNCVGERL